MKYFFFVYFILEAKVIKCTQKHKYLIHKEQLNLVSRSKSRKQSAINKTVRQKECEKSSR